MAQQPYPSAYDNRTGDGRYRRRAFDRLLDRLFGHPPIPLRPQPGMERPEGKHLEELMKRQRNPYLRRRQVEEAEEEE